MCLGLLASSPSLRLSLFITVRTSPGSLELPTPTGCGGVDGEYLNPHFSYQPCRACRNQQQNYPM